MLSSHSFGHSCGNLSSKSVTWLISSLHRPFFTLLDLAKSETTIYQAYANIVFLHWFSSCIAPTIRLKAFSPCYWQYFCFQEWMLR